MGIENIIKTCNIRKKELDESPNNLYIQFKYYCALRELETYKS